MFMHTYMYMYERKYVHIYVCMYTQIHIYNTFVCMYTVKETYISTKEPL